MIRLTPQHVQGALTQIDRDGVPHGRRSRTYCLVTSDGKHYPPKYALELAWRHAGRRIGAQDHLGGKRNANVTLADLGFTVVHCKSASTHF